MLKQAVLAGSRGSQDLSSGPGRWMMGTRQHSQRGVSNCFQRCFDHFSAPFSARFDHFSSLFDYFSSLFGVISEQKSLYEQH